MSIEAELRAEFDRWERNEKVFFAVLPYALLSLCTLITLVLPFWDVSLNLPVVLGLTAALALWTAGFHAHPRWRHSGSLTGLYYVGLIVLGASVVALAPWYGIFTFIGYVHAFLFLKGAWRYAGVAATAVIQAASSTGGLPCATVDEWLVLSLVIIVLAAAFFRFAELDDRRNHRQKRALDRVARGERQAGGGARGERRPARPTARPGPRGGRARRAAADGAGDPRHARPGPRPASSPSSQAAEQAARPEPAAGAGTSTPPRDLARDSLTEARRSVHALRPEPLDDARLPEAMADVAPALVASCNASARRSPPPATPRPMHPEVEVDAAAHRAGGAGQRRQARPRQPGRADPVVHGGSGHAGRARRRRRLRLTAPARPRRRRVRAAAMRQRVQRSPGSWRSSRNPAAARRSRRACRPCRGSRESDAHRSGC